MNKDSETGVLARARAEFRNIAQARGLLAAPIEVTARPLTAAEAIGAVDRDDYPIIVGKERVIEARAFAARGHAFTDSPRDFSGTLAEVLQLPLVSNAERAVFVATLNAVLSHLGLAERTVHCRDEDPARCAEEIAGHLKSVYGAVSVGLIGLNPAIAEALIGTFGAKHVRITDLDPRNRGRQVMEVEIGDGSKDTPRLIEAVDVVVVTGTTLVNGTFDEIHDRLQALRKAFHVYGVTAAGVCVLCGLPRLCPYGRDG